MPQKRPEKTGGVPMKPVKIVAICASPRKKASYYVAEKALEAAAAVDPRIETELIGFV